MARLLVWSDLHNEHWDALPEIPDSALDVDAMLLAGDTSTRGRHVDIAHHFHSRLDKPVIMVRGNHEFYGSQMDRIIAEDTRHIAQINAAGGDIRMLDGNATEIAGTRIVGATLWTDLDLYPGYAAQCRKAVRFGMNDFRAITTKPGFTLDIETWIDLHWKDRDAILSELGKVHDGPTVVMTHHVPVRQMIHAMREIGHPERYLLNAGFASDMAWQLKNYTFDAWVCGHSHDNCSTEIQSAHGMVPFVANARGYPWERSEFNPGYVLTTVGQKTIEDPSV